MARMTCSYKEKSLRRHPRRDFRFATQAYLNGTPGTLTCSECRRPGHGLSRLGCLGVLGHSGDAITPAIDELTLVPRAYTARPSVQRSRCDATAL